MHYIYETKHFLLRKRTTQDVRRLPDVLSESNTFEFIIKQNFDCNKKPPIALMIEFRSTGALAGVVAARDLPDHTGKAEALCRLCKEFQWGLFKEEIMEAMSMILGFSGDH